MFELTINNTVYQFRFGLGFVREINKTVQMDINGSKNAKKDAGLQFAVADLMDGNPVGLVEILLTANKTESPRLSRNDLDAYIEDDSTDIDALFEDVLDFLRNANATKKTVAAVEEMVEQERAKTAQ